LFGRFGRKLGGLYDDNVKDVSGSACAINKMEEEVVLHTQEVARFNNIRPGMESNSEKLSAKVRVLTQMTAPD
jgi:hypothetical protein